MMRRPAKMEPTTIPDDFLMQMFSDNPSLENMPFGMAPFMGDQTQGFSPGLSLLDYQATGSNDSNSIPAIPIHQSSPGINQQVFLPSPLLVLNLVGHSGDDRFSVDVPKLCGKNKWAFSYKLNKLFAGKNMPFPVKVHFPAGEKNSVIICPVFESTGMRFYPVNRCYNCSSSEMSPMREHLVRVDGTECYYHVDKERTLVEVPLCRQSLDEIAMTLLLRMTCRTSCVGGPNRNPFALLFTFLDENRQQMATDVLHVKCCESPIRDLKNEVKQDSAVKAQDAINEQQVSQISSSLETKPRKKRKLHVDEFDKDSTVSLVIPKKYEKKVRTYVNLLYSREKCAKSKLYFSTTDTD